MTDILSLIVVLSMAPITSPQKNGKDESQLSSFDLTYNLLRQVASIENKNDEIEKKLAGLEKLSSTVQDQQKQYDDENRELKEKTLELETLVYEMQSQLEQCQCHKEKSCRPGYKWYFAGGYCYRFYSACKTWGQAKAQCRADGGDLLMLKTTRELTDFVSILKKQYASGARYCGAWRSVWVGATDSSQEGTWRWSDGTTANLAGLWASGDPNNYRNEDCLFLAARSDWKYLDADCFKTGHQSAFVCAMQS